MDLEKLVIPIELDQDMLKRSVDGASNQLGTLDKLSMVGGGLIAGGMAVAAGGVALLGKELYDSVQGAAEAEDIQGQLNAVLRSTGGAAGVSADMVNRMAGALQTMTPFEDDAIVKGESMLLTFTNIGKDVFPLATQTMLDMSQAMGQDMQSSAIQLGKALNDPTKGMTALTRVGVTFTDEQKDLIKTLQESGDLEGAQNIILQELQKEFGGSAQAAGSTFNGALTILDNTVNGIKDNIGAKFIPVLTKLGKQFTETLNKPEVQAAIDNLAQAIADFAQKAVDYIPIALEKFQEVGNWLQNNQGVIVGVLAALGVAVGAFVYTVVIPAVASMLVALWPVLAIMAAVAAVAYLVYEAWTNNWGGIRDTLTDVWNNTLAPIFQTVVEWLQTNIPVAIQALSNFWTNTLLPALTAVWNFIKINIIPLFQALAGVYLAIVKKEIEILSALWSNVLLPALQSVWKFIQANILPVLQQAADKVSKALGPALQWLKNSIIDPLTGSFGRIGGAIQNVIGWLRTAKSTIDSLSLPSWLQPGSPTPFEMGLRGIGSAMQDLSGTKLPTFRASLDIQGEPATAQSGRLDIDYARLGSEVARSMVNALLTTGAIG